jgi:multidrug efflux pump subunit AcrA (membrane-fusion protein)
MAILLFRLRGVPDDEAADVRQLLQEHGIEFYETTAGNWGISMPGIWLRDKSRLDDARQLLAGYQQQRQSQARADYELARARGERRTVRMLIAEAPLRVALLLAALLLILYLSVMPFMHFLAR